MIVKIAGAFVTLDRQAAHEMLSVLSELHGRYCQEIIDCGDMSKSNALAENLQPIFVAYKTLETKIAKER